jgi:hypothetical protein
MQTLFNMGESSSFSRLLAHRVSRHYVVALLMRCRSARIYVFNVSGQWAEWTKWICCFQRYLLHHSQ